MRTYGRSALFTLVIALPLAFDAGCGASSPAPAVSSARAPSAPTKPAWVAKSDAYARRLLENDAKYGPEGASDLGVEGYDDKTIDLYDDFDTRYRADLAREVQSLKGALTRETDPKVREDLAIMIGWAERKTHLSLVHEKHEVPFVNVAELVFGGIKALLDDQVAPARRNAAVVRLRRYAGVEPGSKPITELARAYTMRAIDRPGLMQPGKDEVQKALSNSDVLVTGIESLFAKYNLPGYTEALRAFKEQAVEYDTWLRTTLLPRARADFRLHPEVYAAQLRDWGIEAAPEDLVTLGHQGFDAIQLEMQKVAADVAKERKLPSSDYRDVIRTLKKEQLVGDGILPVYTQRLHDIEVILEREHVITLPHRAARIRLASAAESARQPAPYLDVPHLIGNQGEQGVFVLPVTVPMAPGAKEQRLDDFTFAAASWTLTAHEARPGHELQFASMVEQGVSLARAVFAFNSANVEGWALYAEALVYPYMPAEGKLISLQLRLERAARCFLDPELELGKRMPDQARALLENDVADSPAWANSEVERFMFRMPGQAPSYFYGFSKLMALRAELEKKLGGRFDLRRFNDWVIAQGLLPPPVLRDAALREFGAG